MVQEQLIPRGITDPATVVAMETVPREVFMPMGEENAAYLDGAQPIGEGQTISQPYIVALMTQSARLSPEDKVLEIGTGSGYGAAILSRVAREVVTVERIPSLTTKVNIIYKKLGYDNILVKVANGSLGWKEESPYDAIVVTAAAPKVPKSLVDQLKVGGRLVIPVGSPLSQVLVRITKLNDKGHFDEEALEYVRFVPLIGKEGWA